MEQLMEDDKNTGEAFSLINRRETGINENDAGSDQGGYDYVGYAEIDE